MDILEELQNNGLKISKKHGGTYEWQDTAVRFWKELKISGKPSTGWFKLFKLAFAKKKQGLLNTTYSVVADANTYNPEHYFYKVFSIKSHEHTS